MILLIGRSIENRVILTLMLYLEGHMLECINKNISHFIQQQKKRNLNVLNFYSQCIPPVQQTAFIIQRCIR